VEVVKVEYEESKLEENLYNLIKLISSREMFETELRVAGLDLTRMPLGRISPTMIKDGYKILNQIESELGRSGGPRREILSELSGRFYTVIPHSFGFSKAVSFMINSVEKVREKSELLEDLEGVRKGLEKNKKTKNEPVEKITKKRNPVDDSYETLGWGLETVPRDSEEFRIIQTYKENTQGETHTARSTIKNIYKLVEPGKKRKRAAGGGKTKKLLWHGSRLTNWMSILSSGLKIAPPEAPHTGYMFGKGIYTADCFSKAANYCFVSESRQRTGLIVLCEVDLGKSLELEEADYEADKKLGAEYQSTKGVGKWYPSPDIEKTIEGGVVVPLGKLVCKEENEKAVISGRSSSRITGQYQKGLLYNEYIVYDPSKVKMKYLVELEFSSR
jgi:poly [ADP-ribose] polymerase